MCTRTSSQIYRQVADQTPLELDASLMINNPVVVRDVLGDAIQYAQSVEGEIPESAELVRVLLPNRDASFDMFLNEWEPQEAAHGRVLGGVLDVLGVPRAPVMVKADGPARLVGKAVKRVSSLGDMAETIVASYAALGEKETYIAYNTLYRHARSLGEEALADAVFRPIARQEALHLAFYTAFVGEQMDGLTLRQRSFVGWFIERFYSPVGVQRGNEQRMAGFGRMVATLTDDPETVTTKVESFAHDLLQRSGTVKPFLSPRYQRCVDLA